MHDRRDDAQLPEFERTRMVRDDRCLGNSDDLRAIIRRDDPLAGQAIYLDSEVCSLDDLASCEPCTPSLECFNPCEGPCELCFTQTAEDLEREYTVLILASVSDADGELLRTENETMDVLEGPLWEDDIGEWERGGHSFQRGLREGLARGREEGREEGRREALARALRTIIALRGFELDPTISARIDVAPLAQLERWIERSPTAPNLEVLVAD